MAKSDLLELALFLANQPEPHRKRHGYTLQHIKCIQDGYAVAQNAVRRRLKLWS